MAVTREREAQEAQVQEGEVQSGACRKERYVGMGREQREEVGAEERERERGTREREQQERELQEEGEHSYSQPGARRGRMRGT